MTLRFYDLNDNVLEIDEFEDFRLDTVTDLISNEIVEYRYIEEDTDSYRVYSVSKETYEALKKVRTKNNSFSLE